MNNPCPDSKNLTEPRKKNEKSEARKIEENFRASPGLKKKKKKKKSPHPG